MRSETSHLYEFGPFRLDASERVLSRDGKTVPLTPKAFETLLALVGRSGQVVGKVELLKQVWPDTFVEEATLAQNIFTLRKALGNGQNNGQTFIETVPKRGYRFAAPVREVTNDEGSRHSTADTGATNITNRDDDATTRGNNIEAAPPYTGSPVADDTDERARLARVSSVSQAREQPPPFQTNDGGTAARGRPVLGAVVIVVLVVAAAVGVVYGVFRLSVRPQTKLTPLGAASFQTMKITRLPVSGRAVEAAISPDGRYVVYAENEGGRSSLWVKQVEANGAAHEVIPAAEGLRRGLVFARDGEHVYFVEIKESRGAQPLYRVPILGGTVVKVLDNINSPVTISPDGNRIAFARVIESKSTNELVVANADGTQQRVLGTRRFPNFFGMPAWSPDGKVILCSDTRYEPHGASASVVVVGIDDGVERPVTPQRWHGVGQLAWLPDGSGIVLNAVEHELNPSQIWQISYPNGEVRRITNDLNSYEGVSLTTNAGALVTLQTDRIARIWVVPNGDAARATQTTSGSGTFDGFYGLTWTPDGRIVYASIASGAWDIWVMNADGSNRKQLTASARSNYGPTVSPDGRHIVFVSNRAGGAFNVWRMEIDGSNPQQLTTGNGENFVHVTPDGRWVVYASVGSGQPNLIWKVPFDGGAPVAITDRPASWPTISPDGKLVACIINPEAGTTAKLALVSIDGGAPLKLFDLPPTARANTVFAPDGRGVMFLDVRGGLGNIWVQSLDGAPPRQVTNFTSDGIIAYDWSPDGKQLATARGVENTGVVLIRDFK